MRSKSLLRGQWPALLPGIGLMLFFVLLDPRNPGALAFAYFVGCCAIGAGMFAAESAPGALAQLLAQPIPRSHVWRERLLVTIGLLVPLAALFLLLTNLITNPNVAQIWLRERITVGFVTPLFALGIGPLFTLALRQSRIGLTASIATGCLTYLVVSLVAGRDSTMRFHLLVGAAAVMALAGTALGLRQWLGLQDYNWLEKAFPGLRKNQGHSSVRRSFRPISALTGKEWRFQCNNLVLLFALVVIGAFLPDTGNPGGSSFAIMITYLIPCVPVLFGIASIVEEHRLGTEVWHEALPHRRALAWGWKLVVATGFAMTVATAMAAIVHFAFDDPLWLKSLLRQQGLLAMIQRTGGFHALSPAYLPFAIVTVCLGMVAGQVGRGYPQALAAMLIFLFALLLMLFVSEIPWTAELPLQFHKLTLWPTMIFAVGWSLASAYLNNLRMEATAERGRRVFLHLLLGLGIIIVLQPFFAYRTWEVLLPSPKTGKALYPGRDPAPFFNAIVSRGAGIDPDGRWWLAEFRGCRTKENEWTKSPKLEVIGPEHRWRDVAGGYLGTYAAIRSDGTLWTKRTTTVRGSAARRPRIVRYESLYPTRLTQFGAATNWIRITGYGSHFVGLRRDGTLWHWGENRNFALGSTNAALLLPTPTRIGANRIWKDVLVVSSQNFALDASGRMFEWGRIWTSQNKKVVFPPRPAAQFTNVVADSFIHGGGSSSTGLLVRDNDRVLNLWGNGAFLKKLGWEAASDFRLVPEYLNPHCAGNPALTKDGQILRWNVGGGGVRYQPIDESGDWVGAYGDLGLKKDGSLWQLYLRHDTYGYIPSRWRPKQIGRLFPEPEADWPR